MQTVKLLLPNKQMLTFDNQEYFDNYNWNNYNLTDEVYLDGMEHLQPMFLEFETPTEIVLSLIPNQL